MRSILQTNGIILTFKEELKYKNIKSGWSLQQPNLTFNFLNVARQTHKSEYKSSTWNYLIIYFEIPLTFNGPIS